MSVEAFRRAMEAGDIDAVAGTFAPDVVLNSPITMRHGFRGREEVRQLFTAVLREVDEIAYDEELGQGSTHVVFGTGRVRGQDLHESILLRENAEGLIAEITLFIRPMPGLLTLAAALAPHVGPSRRRSRIAGTMVRPLAAVARRGEAVAARVVWPP